MGRIFKKRRSGKLSSVYTMRYRLADGRLVERSTKCRHKDSAQQVLRDAEKYEERIKSGLVSQADAQAIDWQCVPLEEHVQAWTDILAARGRTPHHVADMRQKTARLLEECAFRFLRDLNRQKVEHWLAEQTANGMPPRTRNGYLGAAVALCNWLVRDGRMVNNPLQGIEKANIQVDRRRVRRALSEKEFRQLLRATKARPLHDALYKNRGDNPAKLTERNRERLSLLGEERAMIYIVLANTGLRKSELASIRLCDTHLDTPRPFLELRPEYEKNRQGSRIPLRTDIAEALNQHIAKRLETQQRTAQMSGRPIPVTLDADGPLLEVPDALIKVFRRDMKHARIPERDSRGRVADVHSLRMFFASHLARAGVPLRTAQELMRHSDPKLTAGIYQDVGVLDVRGAVEALPSFAIDTTEDVEAEAVAGEKRPPIRPPLDGKNSHFVAIPRTEYAKRSIMRADAPDKEKALYLQANSASDNTGHEEKNGSGARIRTADTWIMIPLL